MGDEPVYYVEGDDEGMAQAGALARRTFKFLWRELSWEYRRIIPALEMFAVKVPFENEDRHDGEPECEHMWIDEIEFDGDEVRGTLLNEAQRIESLTAGTSVSTPLEDIGDWMYSTGGKVYGAFTVNYMRAKMPPRERSAHDRAWGLKFGNPETIKVAPGRRQRRGFVNRLFASEPEPPSLEELERTEHPASENMAAKIEETLTSNPSTVIDVDDDGWSMLHRESLAGNLTPVKILVAHGADCALKTPSGYTALDLARKMGWPLVVEHLENNR